VTNRLESVSPWSPGRGQSAQENDDIAVRVKEFGVSEKRQVTALNIPPGNSDSKIEGTWRNLKPGKKSFCSGIGFGGPNPQSRSAQSHLEVAGVIRE